MQVLVRRSRVTRSWAAAALAAAVGLAGAWALPGAEAAPAPASHAATARPTGTLLKFTFDSKRPLRNGAKIPNVAGKGRGTVEVGAGHFRKVRGKPGKAARYPLGSGYGLIEAPDRKVWDPARREFTFGARVRVAASQTTRNMNIMQKGYYKQPGGQWKLQLDQGKPSCRVRGDAGSLLVRSDTSVTDGAWHRLVCVRTNAGLSLRVDGTQVASASGSTGKVANSSVIRIGAKKLGSGRVDQFHGRLDVPFLTIR
jgi:hypothetical protein